MSFMIFALLKGWKTLLGKLSFTGTLSLSIFEKRILGCLSKDASEAVILPALGKNFSFYIQRKISFWQIILQSSQKTVDQNKTSPLHLLLLWPGCNQSLKLVAIFMLCLACLHLQCPGKNIVNSKAKLRCTLLQVFISLLRTCYFKGNIENGQQIQQVWKNKDLIKHFSGAKTKTNKNTKVFACSKKQIEYSIEVLFRLSFDIFVFQDEPGHEDKLTFGSRHSFAIDLGAVHK